MTRPDEPPAGDEPPADGSGAPSRGRALLLVLAATVSVQFGGAIAATLVPVIGAAGSVALRLVIGAIIMVIAVRPRVRGHSRRAWLTVVLFGLALAAMNWTFYASLGHLHIGVAVTVEFLGPLVLATVLSRRLIDLAAVGGAAIGVLLISHAFTTPFAELDLVGIGLALAAGAFWAAYIVLSGRTGAAFPRLDGLALAMIVAATVVFPFGVGGVGSWTPEIWAKGLGVAVLSSVLPYSFELLALRSLDARAFGILLSMEPAVAALAGLIVLGQYLDLVQIIGMCLVVAASAAVMGARRTPPATIAAEASEVSG